MDHRIAIHGFETSNNMKVRVALGFKGIPYDFDAIDPADRTKIVALSGQHLTPVLVHGDRVLFDSAAILRYLDANFRDTPPLFGGSRDEQWEIEDQELFARTALAGPMMALVHARVAGKPVDAARGAELTGQFFAALGKIVARLDGREWLVGDRMTAADVTAAPVVHRVLAAGLFTPEAGGDDPFAPCAPWRERVMAFDRHRTS